MRGTILWAVLLLLHVVVTVVAGGGGKGLGGRGHGLGGRAKKAYGCRPQIHYVTHYLPKYQDIPVHKTVTTHDLEVRPQDAVIYSTYVAVHTRSLTTTVTQTTTEYLTRVSRREVTETRTRVVQVPAYTTTTKLLQQARTLDFTHHQVNTEEIPYPVTLTKVATVEETLTVPVTLVEKSGVPVFRDHVIVDTSTDFYTVTEIVPSYGLDSDVVYVTENVVDVQASYVTQTEYRTSYVTQTSVQFVPSYVTETVHAPCRSYY